MKLRVAIVGCGKIADQHLPAIGRIPECEIVALCDSELLMARQLGERFGISRFFSDVRNMLEARQPDVVHITTPPQSHFAIAKSCLDAGAHVYLEKPFTVTACEAESLVKIAQSNNLKICAGHNYQFTPEMMEMRRLVQNGFLGGRPVHLESHWSYDLDGVTYMAPVLGNRNHWVRQLPGQLFQNLISHGVARLAEFLDEKITDVSALSHQSPALNRLGGEEIQDELRVHIRDRLGTTAFLCFSTQIKPGLNLFRICGPKGSIAVDATSGSLIRYDARACKSYLTYFIPPVRAARQHLANGLSNMWGFLRGRLHQDFGMKELIERFYRSIREKNALPISYREIITTAHIMDEVFTQVYPRSNHTPNTTHHWKNEICTHYSGKKRGIVHNQNP